MQQIYCLALTIFRRKWPALFAALLPILGIGAGCIERPTTIDPAAPKPHAGVELRIAAADAADRPLLTQLAREWASRSGARVKVLDTPWDGSADVGLVPVADLGRWAESGQLATVPHALKQPTNPYHWDDLLPAYSVRLTNWSDQTYGLPVLGEGMVVVYRKDLLVGKGEPPHAPPSGWDDLLDFVGTFGDPYLPPLPKDPERLLAEFFSAAACHDRAAVARIGAGELIRDDFFAFQFDPATGDPRLDAPAFQHVAKLFAQMMPHRCQAADTVQAFKSGKAKVGIVSLAELARIGPETAEKLGVVPLPGARSVFGHGAKEKPTDQQTLNRVPYLGWGGRIGVVSAKCPNRDAAWDFLAYAGMPDREALDLIADARLGAGPYRTSQLDSRARPRWFGYGLTAPETDRLTSALRDNLAISVQNYRIALRTPNQRELAAALDSELRKALGAKEPVDMAKINRRWLEIIRKQPAREWKAVARKSLGL